MTITSHDIGGYAAYTITAPRLAITCLPTRGAHLVSLRSDDHEWLWMPVDGPALLPIGATGDFSLHQEGGDDCFPTIMEDVVQGVVYPGHGSVWNRPWRIISTTEALDLTIDVPSTGLECRRRIQVEGGGLRLDWRISNHYDQPVSYLWAWHPLFHWRSGDHLDIAGISSIDYPIRGKPGLTSGPWPSPYSGVNLALGELGGRKSMKCFVDATGEARLQSGNQRLIVRWDPVVLPHLGLWFKHHDGHDHWAIEPTNVRADCLKHLPHVPATAVLAPHGERSWSIRLDVDRC